MEAVQEIHRKGKIFVRFQLEAHGGALPYSQAQGKGGNLRVRAEVNVDLPARPAFLFTLQPGLSRTDLQAELLQGGL
jgi:hypothetical protein